MGTTAIVQVRFVMLSAARRSHLAFTNGTKRLVSVCGSVHLVRWTDDGPWLTVGARTTAAVTTSRLRHAPLCYACRRRWLILESHAMEGRHHA